MKIKLTHISLLTDLVFDPAGGKYFFGWGGLRSKKNLHLRVWARS